MSNQLLQSSHMTITIQESIMVITYAKGITIDLEVAKQMVEDRLSIFNNNNYRVLVDARFIKYASKEARDYFAKKKGLQGITALGILIGNYTTVTMANLFIRMNKPSIPTKIFNTKEEAIKWLEKIENSGV